MPTARKAAPREASPKKTAAKKKTASKKSTPRRKKAAVERVSAEMRFIMIQEAAYFLAEKDGFRKNPSEYWFAAEKMIAQESAD